MTENGNQDSANNAAFKGSGASEKGIVKRVDLHRGSWKDAWEHSPVRIIVVACVACAVTTAGVVSYFDNQRIQNLRSENEALESELATARETLTKVQAQVEELRRYQGAARLAAGLDELIGEGEKLKSQAGSDLLMEFNGWVEKTSTFLVAIGPGNKKDFIEGIDILRLKASGDEEQVARQRLEQALNILRGTRLAFP